jgi:SAM-dependent methyltransferase
MCTVAPLPEETDTQYEDAYTASADANRKNRRLARDYLQKILPHLPRRSFRFLEVGGSYGWLAQLVREKLGAEVLLLEPGRTAVEAARARGLNAESGFIERYDCPGSFDVLCAAHVVEHVRDVGAFLDACRRALKPHGTLLLLTPNAMAWKLNWFGSAWAWAVPEQHTLFLSSGSAKRLLGAHGFEPSEISAHSPGFAHYPFFLARWLSVWRARWPAPLRMASGLFTRPVALLEYVILSAFDSCFRRDRADELFIVATRRE